MKCTDPTIVLYPTFKVFHYNCYLLGFSCNFKSKKYYPLRSQSNQHKLTINLQSGKLQDKDGTHYVVNLEFDIFILFPSLLHSLISVLHFFVRKGKVKNREKHFQEVFVKIFLERVLNELIKLGR